MKGSKKSIFFLIAFIILGGILLITFSAKNAANVTGKNQNNDFTAERVVSLGPAATEIMFALNAGDKLVARTDLCNYPPEAASIKSIGGFNGQSISLETIIDCKPDLVILYEGMHDYLVEPLESDGIKVYVSRANSIEQVLKEISEIGKLVGREKQAEDEITRMTDRLVYISAEWHLEQISDDSTLKNNTVFWQVYDEPLMTVGKKSFISDIIEYAGGKNIFDDIEQPYPVITMEEVINRKPEFFICVQNYSKQTKDEIEKKFGIKKVIVIPPEKEDIFVRPGPRCVEAVEKLSGLLWNEN
ncbi:MAG: helical backbone metal receptor [Treponema sp.]|uniref:helical backbone metal receptor n=1 Tax=Treponema sp. TaxID=166 RepID=UPI00298E96BB|nr:helical backbone metal receptor [Treponema sp.]MCR5386349.1 helical backbone metal receptor [Treponema sp.]